MLKDLRNDLYEKTVDLPISFYSEKRKGDTMARISTDVLEIQHSFLSILELIGLGCAKGFPFDMIAISRLSRKSKYPLSI